MESANRIANEIVDALVKGIALHPFLRAEVTEIIINRIEAGAYAIALEHASEDAERRRRNAATRVIR